MTIDLGDNATTMTDTLATTDALATRAFPSDFLFGAATAAFQIEGAAFEDGRTASIWDAFCRVPGAVVNADNGDIACDHYHRMPQDVALMQRLGLQDLPLLHVVVARATRRRPGQPEGRRLLLRDSSTSSSRRASSRGSRCITGTCRRRSRCAAAGRTATRRSCSATTRVHMHEALGDRVDVWTTLNEPWCSSFLSYTGGAHAPGRQDVAAGLAAGHHLLLAHGLAVQSLRERDPELQLGITLNLTVAKPVDPTHPGDVDAARRIDAQFNRFFLDPIFRGHYAGDLMADVGHLGLRDVVQPGDLEVISTPIDTLGVNYYHGEYVSDRPAEQPLLRPGADRPPDPVAVPGGRQRVQPPAGAPAHGDGVGGAARRAARAARARAAGLRGIRRRSPSMSPRTVPPTTTTSPPTARCTTPSARTFLEAHLGAILDAIDEGVPVHGYFYWSLMDNFEWAWGYDKRFGLVRVDYDSQERTVKDSGLEYAAIIRDRALPAR